MNPKADIAAIADELDAVRPDLAERLRDAIGQIGRPPNELHKARLKRVRDWMIRELDKGREREDVLAEAVRKNRNTTKGYWWNVLQGKGRPPGYFD